ncbi:MAG: hypothetical protein R3F62_26860 [Planctomycetota bacterium]
MGAPRTLGPPPRAERPRPARAPRPREDSFSVPLFVALCAAGVGLGVLRQGLLLGLVVAPVASLLSTFLVGSIASGCLPRGDGQPPIEARTEPYTFALHTLISIALVALHWAPLLLGAPCLIPPGS